VFKKLGLVRETALRMAGGTEGSFWLEIWLHKRGKDAPGGAPFLKELENGGINKPDRREVSPNSVTTITENCYETVKRSLREC
jgi:hypothetical protein